MHHSASGARRHARKTPPASMFQNIPLASITPDPNQPRKTFDDESLASLAQTMAADGQLAAVLVRPVGSGFQLVHGERRYRAAKRLGWETITAEVRELTDKQARRMALIENIQRESLTPIDEARALQAVLDTGITQVDLGKQIGKQQSYIAQKLRLLRMPAPLVVLVEHGAITENHARHLLKLERWYHGLTEQLTRTSETVTAREAGACISGIRPLDGYFGAPVVAGQPSEQAILDALNTWRESDGDSAVWVRIALWYGIGAALGKLTVTQLAKGIDTLKEHVYSAMIDLMFVQGIEKKEPPPPNTSAWFRYWGYRSDLRHAGIPLGILTTDKPLHPLTREMIEHHTKLFGSNGAWLLPTECQHYGQHADAYRAAMAKEGGQ